MFQILHVSNVEWCIVAVKKNHYLHEIQILVDSLHFYMLNLLIVARWEPRATWESLTQALPPPAWHFFCHIAHWVELVMPTPARSGAGVRPSLSTVWILLPFAFSSIYTPSTQRY